MQGLFPQNAVFKIHLGQYLRLHMGQTADAVQHDGVARADVEAGPQGAYRNPGGDPVQILPGDKPSLLHCVVVPSLGNEVGRTVLLNPFAAALDKFLDAAHAK